MLAEHSRINAAMAARPTTALKAWNDLEAVYREYGVSGWEIGRAESTKGKVTLSNGSVRLLGDRTIRIDDNTGGFQPINFESSGQEVIVVLTELSFHPHEKEITDAPKLGITHPYRVSRCLLLVTTQDPRFIIDESSVNIEPHPGDVPPS